MLNNGLYTKQERDEIDISYNNYIDNLAKSTKDGIAKGMNSVGEPVTIVIKPISHSKSSYNLKFKDIESAEETAQTVLPLAFGYCVEVRRNKTGRARILLTPKTNDAHIILTFCDNAHADLFYSSLEKQAETIREKYKAGKSKSLIKAAITDYGEDYNRESFYDTVQESLDSGENVTVDNRIISKLVDAIMIDIAQEQQKLANRSNKLSSILTNSVNSSL